MGYTTDFTGEFTITPPLNAAEVSYLRDFATTRRMDREEGPYFAHDDGNFGQTKTEGIRDFNRPPEGQPGLWCQWVPSSDGTTLEWDGGEKFYHADKWIKYLVEHFLRPGAEASNAGGVEQDERLGRFTFDHVVNGTVDAQGEDPDDRWRIVIEDNVVYRHTAVVAFIHDGEPV